MAAASKTPASGIRVVSTGGGTALACTAVGPSGAPLLTETATVYRDLVAAHRAAFSPASAGEPVRAQLTLVEGVTVVRLAVPTTAATATMSPAAAAQALDTVTSTWPP